MSLYYKLNEKHLLFYVSVILWLNIVFYCEKCVCTHLDHMIMIQAKKSETIDIKAICLSIDYDFKEGFFLPLSVLVEANLAKSLTELFEKLHPPLEPLLCSCFSG